MLGQLQGDLNNGIPRAVQIFAFFIFRFEQSQGKKEKSKVIRLDFASIQPAKER